MAKKYKIYERFLLSLSFCTDRLVDLYLISRNMRKRGNYYFFDTWMQPGYNRSNFHSSLNRVLKTGYIEKVIKDGKPYLCLTSKGKKRLKRNFPLLKMQNKKWDYKWRIVIFDIKEKVRYKRDILREKLVELGFGMLQQSVYISPHDFLEDIYEFLQTQNLTDQVFVFTAKHYLMGDAQEFAEKIWKIEDLENKYFELLQKIFELKKEPAGKVKLKKIRQIKQEYLVILSNDPFLPFELLPEDWIGEQVKKEVIKLK